MSGFSAGWLELREPADADARDAALALELAADLARRLQRGGNAQIVDLGCGTGANLRWLAPRLAGGQRWLLLDNDPELLRELPRRLACWSGQSPPAPGATHGLELGVKLHASWRRLDVSTEALPLADAHLVTASALADLVSSPWLAALAASCAAADGGLGAAVLLTLCYDGRLALCPRHPDDARVRDAVNRHQLRDKGFGPALGPMAAARAAAAFAAHGYRVLQARSDWCLDAGRQAMQRDLLGGWHQAAREQLGDGRWLDEWLHWRLSRLAAAQSSTRVGHVDLLALPRP